MSLETDVQLLARVPMLSEFSEDKLRLLAFSAENRTYHDGQQLFAAGDRADAGFVVAEGEVVLTGPDGAEAVEVAGPGSLVGELALMVEGERAFTATARGTVDVIVIRRPLFRRMLEEYPDVARRMYARMTARLGETTAALMRVKNRLDAIDR